jgi:hypothetical protein
MNKYESGAMVERQLMYCTKKAVLVLLCPPQFPYELPWDRTCASAVRSKSLAIAYP